VVLENLKNLFWIKKLPQFNSSWESECSFKVHYQAMPWLVSCIRFLLSICRRRIKKAPAALPLRNQVWRFECNLCPFILASLLLKLMASWPEQPTILITLNTVIMNSYDLIQHFYFFTHRWRPKEQAHWKRLPIMQSPYPISVLRM
jgi:hypothetical protein